MAALLLLLLDELHLQHLLLAALAFEAGVIAAPQGQPGIVEVEDVIGHFVEQVAVMADDEHGRGIMGEIVDQPERAFEIEIVCRLVEQQDVRLREEHGRERHAHAPAAGELRQGARLRLVVEAEAGQNARRPRRCGMGVDVDEARVDFGDPVRIGGGLRLRHERRALAVGIKHEVDQGAGATGRLLLDASEAGVAGQLDGAALGPEFARDHAKKGGLAGAVAPHKADPRPVGQGRSGAVEQNARAEPIGEVVNVEHGPLSGMGGEARQPPRGLPPPVQCPR